MNLIHTALAAAILYAVAGMLSAARADSLCDRYFVGSKTMEQSIEVIKARGERVIIVDDPVLVEKFMKLRRAAPGYLPPMDDTRLLMAIDHPGMTVLGFFAEDHCTIAAMRIPREFLFRFFGTDA